MTNKQIQDEINTAKEIEKFLKKKKAGKLIVVANDEVFESLNKIYPKFLSNKVGLFIVSNLEYLELDKDTLRNAKIIRPQFLDDEVKMSIHKGAELTHNSNFDNKIRQDERNYILDNIFYAILLILLIIFTFSMIIEEYQTLYKEFSRNLLFLVNQ